MFTVGPTSPRSERGQLLPRRFLDKVEAQQRINNRNTRAPIVLLPGTEITELGKHTRIRLKVSHIGPTGRSGNLNWKASKLQRSRGEQRSIFRP